MEHEDGAIALDSEDRPEVRPLDSPGPGDYNFDLETEFRPKTMATFGRCRSDRRLFSLDQNPGPGYYESAHVAQSHAKGRHDIINDERTANFKSETKLEHQKVYSKQRLCNSLAFVL